VHAGQPTAIGVDRQRATGCDGPAGHEVTALALLAEAQVLQEQDGVDREGVVELDHVDVTRRQPAISKARRPESMAAVVVRSAIATMFMWVVAAAAPSR
jgi:hypothetical protein